MRNDNMQERINALKEALDLDPDMLADLEEMCAADQYASLLVMSKMHIFCTPSGRLH